MTRRQLICYFHLFLAFQSMAMIKSNESVSENLLYRHSFLTIQNAKFFRDWGGRVTGLSYLERSSNIFQDVFEIC